MNLLSMKIPAPAVLFLVIAGGLTAQPVSRGPGKGCACTTQQKPTTLLTLGLPVMDTQCVQTDEEWMVRGFCFMLGKSWKVESFKNISCARGWHHELPLDLAGRTASAPEIATTTDLSQYAEVLAWNENTLTISAPAPTAPALPSRAVGESSVSAVHLLAVSPVIPSERHLGFVYNAADGKETLGSPRILPNAGAFRAATAPRVVFSMMSSPDTSFDNKHQTSWFPSVSIRF
jgi:hypothetical protein